MKTTKEVLIEYFKGYYTEEDLETQDTDIFISLKDTQALMILYEYYNTSEVDKITENE